MTKSSKSRAAFDARVTRIQMGAEFADAGSSQKLIGHPDVVAGKHGVPMRAAIPGGEIVQMAQADGVAIVVQPGRVNVVVDVPEDFQSSLADAFSYFRKRTKKTFGLFKSSGVATVKWAGLIATFFKHNQGAKNAAEAANQWAMSKSLPFVSKDSLSHFAYSIGYSRGGYNEVVQIQGTDFRSLALPVGVQVVNMQSAAVSMAGLEFNIDYNDKPLGKPGDLQRKIDAVSVRILSSAHKWID